MHGLAKIRVHLAIDPEPTKGSQKNSGTGRATGYDRVSLLDPDLLALLQLGFAFSIPIVTAPLLLAIYGFRSTSRTVLIGMGIGAVSMVLWNIWVEPRTGIHGSFFA